MILPVNGGRTGEIGAADGEDARRPLDQSMTYVLTRPLCDGPVMIRQISFREPTAKDLARWSRAAPGSSARSPARCRSSMRFS